MKYTSGSNTVSNVYDIKGKANCDTPLGKGIDRKEDAESIHLFSDEDSVFLAGRDKKMILFTIWIRR